MIGKKKNSHLVGLLVIFLVGVTLLNAYILVQLQLQRVQLTEVTGAEEGNYEAPHVPVSLPPPEGFVPVEIDVTPGIIYLTHNCSQMTMITTASQTYSIENGIKGVIDPRPTPHDIIKDILENWNINVTMARIESLIEGTYYATLVLAQGNRTLLLDCRPSDSIATAIRFGAPVYISKKLLEEQGVDVC